MDAGTYGEEKEKVYEFRDRIICLHTLSRCGKRETFQLTDGVGNERRSVVLLLVMLCAGM